MTAAGSAEVAYRVEDNYQVPDSDENTWIQPGVNVTVGDLSIDNQGTRIRQPDNPTPDQSTPGNFDGSASVSFTLTDDKLLNDLVPGFASTGSLSSASGKVPTAEWYFNVTALENTTTTVLSEFDSKITAAGAFLESLTLNYQEGQNITVDTQIRFADVSANEPGAGNISQPDAASVFTHHGTDLSIDSISQEGLQSATLSLNSLGRIQQDASRTGRAAVVGAMTPELESDAIFTGVDQLNRAIGGTNATSVATKLTNAGSGSITFENGTGTTIDFELNDPQPVNYSWSSLVEPGTDLTEPTTYHLSDVSIL
jgi:hypothetical protein